MNRLSIYAIISLLLLLVSCSQIPNELITAEQLLETAPDSALHILQSVDPTQYKNDEHKALYGLLYIHALDNNFLPLKPDSLLDFSIDYYQKNPHEDKLATCYLYKGRSFKAALEYDKAMQFYMQGLDKLQGSKNFKLLGRINFDLGYIYSIQNDYILARQKYKLAHGYFIKTELKAQAFYSQLNIGRTYHMAKDYTSAHRYYNKLFAILVDSLEQGALLQEYALNFYANKQPDSALIYYRQLIHYPYIGNNKSIRYNYLANVYFDLNILDSAFIYAKEAFMFKPTIRTQRECYRILANTEYLRGNMKEMSAYMSKYVVLGDSLRKIDAQIKGSYIEWMHTTNREVTKTKNRIWYLFGLILMIILTSYLIYIRLHTRSNKEKIRLETEKEQLEYENKRLEIEKVLAEGTHIEQKASIRKDVLHRYRHNLILKIQTIKNEQATLRKNANYVQKEALDRKIYNDLLYLENTASFYREMNTILNGLVDKLLRHTPTLSEKEIHWCCLFLLGVPTLDIYMLLHYQVDSLKKMRQRLAYKLKLQGVAALDAFLIAILSEK